jgi:hypothetical protein
MGIAANWLAMPADALDVETALWRALKAVSTPDRGLQTPLIPIGREPKIVDAATFARQIDTVKLPPLAATMDDCCRIAELLLGAEPSGETPLTIAILTIVSLVELSVSAVYTASPLSGDGVSIDVEYIPPKLLRRG